MAGEQFSLVWNSFPANLSSGLYSLLTDEQLVDVTLAAEGKILRAHKLILSVCSTYFRDLFKGNTCKHPIVILKDVNYRDLSAMLHFMYQGEVNIKQEDIASFLKVAETLQIKGLTKDKADNFSKIEETCTSETVKSEVPTEMDFAVDSVSELAADASEFPHSPLHDDHQEAEKNLSSSSSVTFRSDKTFKLNPGPAQSFSEDYDDSEERETSEPLDFTPDPRQRRRSGDKFAVDYRFGDGSSTSGAKTESALSPGATAARDVPPEYPEGSDTVPTTSSFTNDFVQYDSPGQTKTMKGRRTVKGIAHSALPLETTLRVVSELGPTLRVERGKIVRMYSCPWCLRHFTRKENLKLHVRYIHGPLESLTCKQCGNKYKNSNSLRVHSYLYHNTKRNKLAKVPLVTSNG